jgi:hypothetical protein
MKFLPSIDSVRSICLIAATIATTRSETLFCRERGIFQRDGSAPQRVK